mmetsp:Transcript_68757/g.166234  ORF Transcript_68757/g.166234 Transcript_68757/m.166234 type:complete len:115 (+) Transcript_68757:691-1035(+)
MCCSPPPLPWPTPRPSLVRGWGSAAPGLQRKTWSRRQYCTRTRRPPEPAVLPGGQEPRGLPQAGTPTPIGHPAAFEAKQLEPGSGLSRGGAQTCDHAGRQRQQLLATGKVPLPF